MGRILVPNSDEQEDRDVLVPTIYAVLTALNNVVGAQGNTAWQKARQEWGASDVTAGASMWAAGPAAQRLYGGRMTDGRRHEAVAVTQGSRARFSADLHFAM